MPIIGGPTSLTCNSVKAMYEAMEKVGRNTACPCGSGRKFKHCHGENRRLPPGETVAAILLDHQRKRKIVITKGILVNQILREGPQIANSFDHLTGGDVRAISAVLAEENYKPTCARLLSSATTSFMASLEVARHGFRRPYGALARIIIETLATVLHISVEPTALSQFNAGSLQSTRSIAAAKKVLPPFGRQYGMLSEQFVHINKSHAGFEPIVSYQKDEAALGFIVSSLKSNAWLIYVVAELVFHSEISSPRYWRKVGTGAFVYDPSEDECRRLKQFFDGEAESLNRP